MHQFNKSLGLVVFVEPPNFSLLRKTRANAVSPNGRYFSDQDFAQLLSYSTQLDISYGKFVDFRIVNGILGEALNELIRILHDYESLPSFVPDEWISNDEAFKNSIC